MKPLAVRFFLAVIAAASVFFTTCGLEEEYYLPAIPGYNLSVTSNTRVSITLPGDYTAANGFSYFTGFKLFYRIYISDRLGAGEPAIPRESDNKLVSGTSAAKEEMSKINTSLWSNFNTIYPVTDPAGTTVSTSLPNLLRDDQQGNIRRFYSLELEEKSINDVLDTSSLGSTIYLDFNDQTGDGTRKVSTLEFGSVNYNLFRAKATTYEDFTTKPDGNRYFVNTADLCNSDYAIDNTVNVDVVDIDSDKKDSFDRYTWAAFYIVAMGLNDTTWKPIYSAPTFVGIFRLPNEL